MGGLTRADRLAPDQLAETARVHEARFSGELATPFGELLADDVRVLLDDDGAVLGYAVLRPLGGTGWTFLRYLATARSGQGTGSRLWRELTAALSAEGSTRLLLDVEAPHEAPDGAERALRERRVVFYERLGALVLDVAGHTAHPGQVGSGGLLLLAAGLGGHVVRADDPAERRAVLLAVDEHRYGLAPSHPHVRDVLRRNGLG